MPIEVTKKIKDSNSLLGNCLTYQWQYKLLLLLLLFLGSWGNNIKDIIFFHIYFLVVLGIEPVVPYMLGNCSITGLYLQLQKDTNFVLIFLEFIHVRRCYSRSPLFAVLLFGVPVTHDQLRSENNKWITPETNGSKF